MIADDYNVFLEETQQLILIVRKFSESTNSVKWNIKLEHIRISIADNKKDIQTFGDKRKGWPIAES